MKTPGANRKSNDSDRIDNHPTVRCHDGAFRKLFGDKYVYIKGKFTSGVVVGKSWRPDETQSESIPIVSTRPL